MQPPTTAKARTSAGKKPGVIGWLLLAPMVLWLLAFVVAPTIILLVASFTGANEDTGFPIYEKRTLTTDNYKRIVLNDEGKLLTTEEEDIVNGEEQIVGTQKVTRFAAPYLRVFGYSVLYAGVATVLCVVIGYPVAWFIGRAKENTRNLLLMAVPLAPTAPAAVALTLARFCLSQMDVPARQAYVASVVAPGERSAAAGITNVVRSLGVAVSPLALAALGAGGGAGGADPASLAGVAPFLIAGLLKCAYDVALYCEFSGGGGAAGGGAGG